jgi:hypothetical protein
MRTLDRGVLKASCMAEKRLGAKNEFTHCDAMQCKLSGSFPPPLAAGLGSASHSCRRRAGVSACADRALERAHRDHVHENRHKLEKPPVPFVVSQRNTLAVHCQLLEALVRDVGFHPALVVPTLLALQVLSTTQRPRASSRADLDAIPLSRQAQRLIPRAFHSVCRTRSLLQSSIAPNKEQAGSHVPRQ